MKFLSVLFTMGLGMGLLSACGQYGPLYLPEKAVQTSDRANSGSSSTDSKTHLTTHQPQ